MDSVKHGRRTQASASSKVLVVENLSKRYGDTLAVDGISFEVGSGEIIGLLGPNGAGKTTTINMILGVLQPSSGKIRIEGLDIGTHRSQALERTTIPPLISPFAGVFYPLSTLPRWMQFISWLLPPAYVFEGMRSFISGDRIAVGGLLWGAGLAVFYVLLACWFFGRMYRHAVRTGLIGRYSAESLS